MEFFGLISLVWPLGAHSSTEQTKEIYFQPLDFEMISLFYLFGNGKQGGCAKGVLLLFPTEQLRLHDALI